jgi:hypothetical protein
MMDRYPCRVRRRSVGGQSKLCVGVSELQAAHYELTVAGAEPFEGSVVPDHRFGINGMVENGIRRREVNGLDRNRQSLARARAHLVPHAIRYGFSKVALQCLLPSWLDEVLPLERFSNTLLGKV